MASPGHLVRLYNLGRRGPTELRRWCPSPLRALTTVTSLQTQGVQWMAPLAPVPSTRHSNIVAAREAQRMAPLEPVPLVLLLYVTASIVAGYDVHTSALRRVSVTPTHGKILVKVTGRAGCTTLCVASSPPIPCFLPRSLLPSSPTLSALCSLPFVGLLCPLWALAALSGQASHPLSPAFFCALAPSV